METFVWDEESIVRSLRIGDDIEKKDQHSRTPLIYVCTSGNLSMVNTLIRSGANIEATNSTGWTPLMFACNWGRLDVVKALIQAGANIEAVNSPGLKPLTLASCGGGFGVVRCLVEAGADINAVFLQIHADLSEMDSIEEEIIEKNIHQLTPENIKKWKTYRMKALFM